MMNNKCLTNMLRIRFILELINDEIEEVRMDNFGCYGEDATPEQVANMKDLDLSRANKLFRDISIRIYKIEDLFDLIDKQTKQL